MRSGRRDLGTLKRLSVQRIGLWELSGVTWIVTYCLNAD